MEIICPKCKKPIESGNIFLSQDLAFCGSCNEWYVPSTLEARQLGANEPKDEYLPVEQIEFLSKQIEHKNKEISRLEAEKERLSLELNDAIKANKRLKGKARRRLIAIIIIISAITALVLYAIFG